MNIERQLLHNLACRLRRAKKDFETECRSNDKYLIDYTEGIYREANNSFQAAKAIYYEHIRSR